MVPAAPVVVEVVAHPIPLLLIHVGRELHLHLAALALHVLGEVEACVRAGLAVELEEGGGEEREKDRDRQRGNGGKDGMGEENKKWESRGSLVLLFPGSCLTVLSAL